jgi:hypothetical protein
MCGWSAGGTRRRHRLLPGAVRSWVLGANSSEDGCDQLKKRSKKQKELAYVFAAPSKPLPPNKSSHTFPGGQTGHIQGRARPGASDGCEGVCPLPFFSPPLSPAGDDVRLISSPLAPSIRTQDPPPLSHPLHARHTQEPAEHGLQPWLNPRPRSKRAAHPQGSGAIPGAMAAEGKTRKTSGVGGSGHTCTC